MNRTLPHFIQIRLLTPQTSLKVIDLLERILFPLDGYPAPTPPDPTPEEVIDMREKLEKRIDEMVPGESALVRWGEADGKVYLYLPCFQVERHLFWIVCHQRSVMLISLLWYWILLWLLPYRI